MRFLFFIILCIGVAGSLFAQITDEEIMKGTVYGDGAPLEGVYVNNVTSKVISITTKNGSFALFARAGDTLRCVYMGMKDTVVAITPQQKKNGYIKIVMEASTEQLGEVVVEKQTIDEVSLGIIKEKKQKFTKSERQLMAAGDFKAYQLVFILVGGMPLDPLINAITGRTKRMKKRVELERDKATINQIYEKYYVFMTTSLEVPEDDVMLFLYYLVDIGKDEDVVKAEESVGEFLMTDAYIQFKKEREAETETEKGLAPDKQ